MSKSWSFFSFIRSFFSGVKWIRIEPLLLLLLDLRHCSSVMSLLAFRFQAFLFSTQQKDDDDDDTKGAKEERNESRTRTMRCGAMGWDAR